MEIGIIKFNLTYHLIDYFEKSVSELKTKKYASQDSLGQVFEIVDKIINKSKNKLINLKEDYKTTSDINEKKAILNLVFDLFTGLNLILPLLHDINFSDLNYIDFDNYAIIEYIKNRINKLEDLKDKKILCLVSASIKEMNFYMYSQMFNPEILEYFEKLDISSPELSIHIKYPLIFKDNFLIKTTIFHEFSHLIDPLLNISNEVKIDLDKYSDKIEPIIDDYINNASFNVHIPEDFIRQNFLAKLKEIMRNWIEELIADILSTMLLGPAIRSVIFYWSLLTSNDTFSESHPSFYLRCKYISFILKKRGYKNTKIEEKLLEYSKFNYEDPSDPRYNLLFQIFENEIGTLYNICRRKFDIELGDLFKFFKKKNKDRKELKKLTKHFIPIGGYLSPNKNNDDIADYQKTQISEILNIYWEFFYEMLFESKEKLEKMKIFKLIESRAKKSIDILRGIDLYNKNKELKE